MFVGENPTAKQLSDTSTCCPFLLYTQSWGMSSINEWQAEYSCTQALSDTQGPCLTMISSSRSGDSTRGMITWFRSSGVFSCFSTLFKVFSCPESNAKLSRTEGLEKQMKMEHGKGMPQRAFSLFFTQTAEERGNNTISPQISLLQTVSSKT